MPINKLARKKLLQPKPVPKTQPQSATPRAKPTTLRFLVEQETPDFTLHCGKSLGVHQDSKGWRVSHVATGLPMGRFDCEADAIAACNRLWEHVKHSERMMRILDGTMGWDIAAFLPSDVRNWYKAVFTKGTV